MHSIDAISFIGDELSRPECVLAHESGLLFAPHWSSTGGISIISPDRKTHTLQAKGWDFHLRPNGIALEPGGSFLLAHLGDETGGIFRLFPDGSVEAVVTEIDGQPLPPANFVVRDDSGRLWFTVSTRLTPRARDYRKGANTGYIAMMDSSTASEARIMADGLGYANECVIDTRRERVLVNETFARRLSQFDLATDGTLSNQQLLHQFAKGTFPDGMALDEQGGIWIASIVSNRVIRLQGNTEEVVIEDVDEQHLDFVEEAWLDDSMGRAHLDSIQSACLANISNIAFAGSARTTVHLGCLLGKSIATFESRFSGVAPVHWDADLGDLVRYLD